MAVIFDCDGVMFDSRQANRNYYNHLLARFGRPAMCEEDVAYVHMHTADDSIKHIFRGTPHTEEARQHAGNRTQHQKKARHCGQQHHIVHVFFL